MSDLDPDRLAGLLDTLRFGRPCRFMGTCASTNDEAAAAAAAGDPEGLVIIADAQTGGRGRMGRLWHSPAGENLYLSLLLRPAVAPWALPPITLVAGAALAEVIARRRLAPIVKWPNDLLLPIGKGGTPRKVAGILTEMASDRDHIRHVVLGVGINVNTEHFPAALAERATSLAIATGGRHDRGELLADFLAAFETEYDRALSVGPAAALDGWRRFAALPRPVRLDRDGHLLEGEAIDLDADGALLLRDGRGHVHRILSGEILAE